MTTVVEYFVRHYTLVLDNDEFTYNEVRRAIREITRASDVTVSQYRAMSETDRMGEFGSAIGDKVLDMVGEWYTEAIEGREDSIGGMLIRAIMIDNGSDVAWEIAKHYMPEDSEADAFFGGDETDDDE